jgi:hypothetical protein
LFKKTALWLRTGCPSYPSLKEGSLEGRQVEIEQKWEEERKSEMELLLVTAGSSAEDVCHGMSSESVAPEITVQWKTQ